MSGDTEHKIKVGTGLNKQTALETETERERERKRELSRAELTLSGTVSCPGSGMCVGCSCDLSQAKPSRVELSEVSEVQAKGLLLD